MPDTQQIEMRIELNVTLVPYFHHVPKENFWHTGIRKIFAIYTHEENPHCILWEEEEEKTILLQNNEKYQ